MAQVKCQWCEAKDLKEKMTKEHPKGYIHLECLPKYIKDKEFKRIERDKKDKLAEKIAEIYELESIQMIPHQIWPYIEDIRNDSKLFGKLGKSYKNGIPYEGIEYTLEFCKDKIRLARKTVRFKNLQAELKYGLAIVRNNLADAKNHAINEKRRKELAEIQKNKSQEKIETKVEFKKKEVNNDISSFI
ncbi:hypothetical protein [Paenibacillus cremeus]|uniref:hypothetical protein n=1 Tax=Paenibacillus cremeus TaxID=2163881 RepID=UPI001C955298|nr:hypothetical protein [Paenibacillus cremeus]